MLLVLWLFKVLAAVIALFGLANYRTTERHLAPLLLKLGVRGTGARTILIAIFYLAIIVPLAVSTTLTIKRFYKPSDCDSERRLRNAIATGPEGINALLKECPNSLAADEAKSDYVDIEFSAAQQCIYKNPCRSSICISDFADHIKNLPHVGVKDLEFLRMKAQSVNSSSCKQLNGPDQPNQREIVQTNKGVTEMKLPPLLGTRGWQHSRFSAALKKFYGESEPLLVAAETRPEREQQAVANSMINFIAEVRTWVCLNMGAGAQSKIDDLVSDRQYEPVPNLLEARNLHIFRKFRSNLEDLIRDDTWDPSGRPIPPAGGCEPIGVLKSPTIADLPIR